VPPGLRAELLVATISANAREYCGLRPSDCELEAGDVAAVREALAIIEAAGL